MKGMIGQFVRFAIVGALCTGIDVVLFYLLRVVVSYQLSLIVAYVLSLTVNYFLTVHWTFRTESNVRNFTGIVSAHLFNLFAVRMVLMYVFVEILSIDDGTAYLPTLLISVLTNFIIIKLVVNR